LSTDIDPSASPPQAFLQSLRLHRLLRGLIVLLSGFFLLLFLYTALRRIRYPFELEWVESGMLNSVRRITQGQKLYVAPSIDFVPFLYAPLFFYVAAAFTKFTGVSYVAMRLVSALATLGCCVLIYAFVFTETRRRLAAIAGAGLFLACYPLVEGFYDIGRTDSLFVFFMLLALFFSRRGHPVLAALAWVLCFQTKQTLLPVAIVLLCVDWQRPRRILMGLGTFVLALGGSIAWMNHATHGWYSLYLFHIAGAFGISWRQALLFFPNAVLAPMGVALLLGLAAWALTGVRLRSPVASFYAIVTVVLYGAIEYVAAHNGASANAYMPVYAWTAVLFGVALHRLLAHLEQSDGPRAAVAATVVLAAAATQLAMFLYNPGRFIPPPAVLQARQRFIDQVRAIPGDVYIVDHNYYAVMAGKQPHAEGQSVGTAMDMPGKAFAANMRTEFDNALRSHRYSAVIVDGSLLSDPYHFHDAYPYALSAEGEEGRYLTSQPSWILLPCETAAAIAPMVTREDTSIRPGKCSAVQP
jgi:4-amino-4-deoxy-L-arabinose transferase-like glycosyltransferase